MKRIFILCAVLLGVVSCNKTPQPEGPELFAAENFDSVMQGKPVSLYTLQNANGMVVQVTNYGGIVTDAWVPARDGKPVNVVLGYPTPGRLFCSGKHFCCGDYRTLRQPELPTAVSCWTTKSTRCRSTTARIRFTAES